MSIGFSCTINPADRVGTAQASQRALDIAFQISNYIALIHDTPAARINWFLSINTREQDKITLTAYFYKRKLDEDLPNDDSVIMNKVKEWAHTVNEHPEKWESKWKR